MSKFWTIVLSVTGVLAAILVVWAVFVYEPKATEYVESVTIEETVETEFDMEQQMRKVDEANKEMVKSVAIYYAWQCVRYWYYTEYLD